MNSAARPATIWVVAGVLGAALLVRLALYNGILGSDDSTYFVRALDVANGSWTSANYNGALRYGFNIPAGAFVALFGPTTAAANVWPLLCSIGEIMLVYVAGRELAGHRTGLVAALLLAAAPLHVSVSTRIHADPVVAFFLTAAYVLLLLAINRGFERRRLFAAGLALGGVFWAKELAAVVYVAWLPLLWYFRGRWRDAAMVVAGVVAALVLSMLLMEAIAGDPLHHVNVVAGQLRRNFIGSEQAAGQQPSFYLAYLFLDVRHVGLLGWLALAGLSRRMCLKAAPTALAPSASDRRVGTGFVTVWLVALIVVLSVFPVSLWPLKLPMKQSNYVSLFLAPLALCAAFGIARLSGARRWTEAMLAIAAVAVGLLLAALQQADQRAFTANGKALWHYLRQHPDTMAVGSTSNGQIAHLQTLEHPRPPEPLVLEKSDRTLMDGGVPQPRLGTTRLVAFVDPQTTHWFRGGFERPEPCWSEVARLAPADLGLGNRVAALLLEGAGRLPGSLAVAAIAKLGPLAAPRPGIVYAVPGFNLWCRESPAR